MQTLFGLGLFGLLLTAVTWWVPVILILRADLVWVLLIVFLSWFAWILYLLVAPVEEKLNP